MVAAASLLLVWDWFKRVQVGMFRLVVWYGMYVIFFYYSSTKGTKTRKLPMVDGHRDGLGW